ncbi:unnamed protein product [Arabidopsis halleri]
MAASPTSLTEKPLSRKTFDDLEGVFSEEEVLFRLIHFWEARNHTRGNSLIGLELLLIDEKSTTIQAFIPAATSNAEAPKAANGKAKDKVFLHLLMKDGETVRIYLWDNIAAKFRTRWNASETKPTVLLLTTVNAKFLGGAVTLSSTSASRLFFDTDIAETTEFNTWLSEQDPPFGSSSSAITKIETLTLNELHEFIENETPQEISFQCVATIVNVLGEYHWNYVSCTYCNTMLEKLDTTMTCTTCKKPNKVGVLRYRFEISVSDENNGLATFVIFDREGIHFAGRRAPEVFASEYPEGDDPDECELISKNTPQCILDIVGRTCKFQVKLTPYNFRATRQTFTVSRIIEDNIDIHSKSNQKEMATEEPEHATHVASGKAKNKVDDLDFEEHTKNKTYKRHRHNY